MILICKHDRDILKCIFSTFKSIGRWFFLIFLAFCFLASPLPFHRKQNKTCGGCISDKTRTKKDVLWTSRYFIPFCETTSSLNWIFFLSFSPHGWFSYCAAREVHLLTGHRGNALISLSTQILFCVCYSCHISVRCGSSSSWNNEAMFRD